MEPLGEYLKEVREKKRLSIDKVIEDTHIIKKFITGIEMDDFSVFPGEAYLKGFLRNYSEYLGLNASDIVRRYEKIKLAESPSPMEQLIPKPGYDYSKIIFGVLVLAAISLLAGGMYSIYSLIAKNTSGADIKKVKEVKKKTKAVKSAEKTKTLKMENDGGNFTLKKDEKVSVTLDSGEYTIWLSDLDPTVTINSSAGKQQFVLGNGYTNKFDINGDAKDDVEILLSYWDDKTAKLSLKKIVSSLLNNSNIDSKYFMGDTVETIYEGADKTPIEFSINVIEDCYVKYQSDELPEVAARYSAGAFINIKATEQVIISSANAGAISFNFNKYGKRITPGEMGDIGVKIVAWTKNGVYNSLQMSSLR